MRKLICKICLLFIFFGYYSNSIAQTSSTGTPKADSLKNVLLTQKEDTNKVNTQIALMNTYSETGDSKKALQISETALDLSKKLGYQAGLGKTYYQVGLIYQDQANFTEAIKYFTSSAEAYLSTGNKSAIGYSYYQVASSNYLTYNAIQATKYCYIALKYFEEPGTKKGAALCYQILSSVQNNQGNYEEALTNGFSSLNLRKEIGNKSGILESYSVIANIYFNAGNYPKALENHRAALNILDELGSTASGSDIAWNQQGVCDVYEKLGEVALSENQTAKAERHFFSADSACRIALNGFLTFNAKTTFDSLYNKSNIGAVYGDLGLINTKMKKYDLANDYLQKALELAKETNLPFGLKEAYSHLAGLDSAQGNFKQAFEHYKSFIFYRDNVSNEDNRKKMLQTQMQYDFDKKEAAEKAERDRKDAKTKITRIVEYSVMAVFLLIAIFLFWNNRQKQKSKVKIETAYSELESTQAQLIQSAKMASLGELTAGIAHEIQNPLNFVNNFSEVSRELIDELKNQKVKLRQEEQDEILNDIDTNLEKINLHGKRADSIVKGMLQHSRSSAGAKEPTDINALADEFLRLSYQGLRAKDKSFNSTIKTNFDSSIGKINIISQDIGRVLLNLYNNAFYAVNEKKKTAGEQFEPTVSVSTKKEADRVIIAVKDNGNGIPQNIVDKIFQPFFTTKPTGQGTGLGLSLSYDIIKAHGGEINVTSKDGEETEFIVTLPVQHA